MLSETNTAKQIKDRLRNPVNGRVSSELDVVSAPELRRRRIEAATRRDRERRKLESKQQLEDFIVRAVEIEKRHHAAKEEQERIQRERGYRSVESILKLVCIRYGVTRIDLISDRRTADIVRPRQVAMFLAKTLTLRSLPEIGRRIGGRDHTTVLHGVRKIETLIIHDLHLAAEIDDIKRSSGVVDA